MSLAAQSKKDNSGGRTAEEEEEGDVDDEDEDEVEVEVEREETGRVVHKLATYMKFYSTSPWRYILERARNHSRLAAVADGFPDRLAMLDTYGDEYILQAMEEYNERGVRFDKHLFTKYGYEMKILVCT